MPNALESETSANMHGSGACVHALLIFLDKGIKGMLPPSQYLCISICNVGSSGVNGRVMEHIYAPHIFKNNSYCAG